MSKSIAEITKIIKDFSDERGWANNDPNQLITSILIELGELAENYQWKDKVPNFTEEQKTEVGFEFVDIIFYLFRLAQKSEIDIEKYFDLKLPKLAAKFPVGKDVFEARAEYRKAGKNKRYE
jgi:NTP pyrophosphatase (non-canonical NTP hydrolase)